MSTPSPKDRALRLAERDHVEKPLLDQLAGLGWEIRDLDTAQQPRDTERTNFTEVVMLPVLRAQLQVIQPWLEDDQVEEVVKQLTASFPGGSLVQNNRHVFRLLTEGTSVAENRATGERSPTVRFVDFGPEALKHNRFIAVCQFKVRILGTEHHIYPDIVLFLNGLPVVVIEAKSPKVKEPIPEAIDQLLRYSEQRGAKGEGSALLFCYNQFVVATCRQEAKFGTITTRTEKHFYRWSDPYPHKLDELERGTSSPNDQQRLVAGMMDRRNLLDLLRTFTLFRTSDNGELIKVVGRYQQFRAVKLAVRRLREGRNPRERSGIVWHTQGSGKSLTMMFMVREMYLHPDLAKWKVVFVTDRTQLEEQLAETSQGTGFTVKVADSIKALKDLLRSGASDLVMAMIQKFRDEDLAAAFPELNPSEHILVMTDEAHRSQYAQLAANLDKAIPHASRIGYTGTPIDKTERVFGDYIDKYTMRQAIDDGVTLEIVYEGRTHKAEVGDKAGLDGKFKDVFHDYSLPERLQILGAGGRKAYLEADPTIAAKSKDMVAHYLAHVFPNGYKAQIVATSREAAVRYKAHVDKAVAAALAELERAQPKHPRLARLRRLRSEVIISGDHNDELHLKAFSDPAKHKAAIRSFKLPFDQEDREAGVNGDVGIVIVNNMLLTGFDAPVEQVMYLDKIVVAHGLLQAICRVNRVAGAAKEKGFVVDYVGVGHHLKKALENYDEREQRELLGGLSFPEDELRELRAAHAAILTLLGEHGLTDLTDFDAFYDAFYDEDLRFAFLELFGKFTRNLNLVYPAKEALEHEGDYRALTAIKEMAAKHLRDGRLSMKGIPPKLRAITDAYLESRGIDVKVPPISILDEGFLQEVEKRHRTKTRAAEIEHAIRHHIDVELGDDPELQASFAEALAKILEDFADNWRKIAEELEKLRQRILAVRNEPTYGLHVKKQMPLFRMLRKELLGEEPTAATGVVEETQAPYGTKREDLIGLLVTLTQHLFGEIERELGLTGFWDSIPARQKLIESLQRTLLQPEFAALPGVREKRKHLISRLMEIAKKHHDAILYAS